jgi:pantoate--beta-alanine ligase
MQLFEHIEGVERHLQQMRDKGKRIGFIPTMGAIHEGHLSLIRFANIAGQETVCSIFVNPAQFNDPADLDKYPRPFAADVALLEAADADVLFHPDVAAVYPDGKRIKSGWDFQGLDLPMEGKHRPGHFDGMAKVVNRLLEIVQPDSLYMGQKDYQQFLICKKLIELESHSCEIVMCPIIREEDGLAMSSRNVRLDPPARQEALALFDALQFLREHWTNTSANAQLINEVTMRLESNDAIALEYLKVVDRDNLGSIEPGGGNAIACVAAVVGGVRLIDNLIIS